VKKFPDFLVVGIYALFAAMTAAHADDCAVQGFDRTSYEIALSAADRAVVPELWLRDAGLRAVAATARWETEAAELYSDASVYATAKAELGSWMECDVAERFSAWLRDRFFGRQAADLYRLVGSATRVANERLLYVVEADGSVSYDEAGNPRYLPPGDENTFEADRNAWYDIARSGAVEAVASFGARLEGLRPELLSYVPETQRQRYETLIVLAEEDARGRVARELDALVAREERLFVARKTADVWSLRHRSDGETASSIASALAIETGTACDEGIAALNARIESAEAGTGDLALAGTEWLAAFKQQFDKGIRAWQDAEERFMVMRFEWERDAAQAFDAGNEAWASAFERLACERRAWEAEAGLLFQSGEEAFSKAGETLEASIRDARADFELAAVERTAAGSERAGAWVDVYLQAGAAAAGAREGGEYWLSLLGAGAPAFGSDGLTAWIETEAAKTDADQQRKDQLAQLRDCVETHDRYALNAAEARDRLIADFGMAMGTDAGSLRSILDDGAAGEDFHLDEYQVELIRAKAMEGYWTRRADVARAVLAYATDLSSGRTTEGENLRNLAIAAEAYDEALESYRVAQAGLQTAGVAIQSSRLAMEAAMAGLSAAGLRLENADAEYSILMAVLVAGDAAFIRDDLVARYRDLVAQSGWSVADGAPSEAGLIAGYLAKARALGYANDIERSGEALREAVNGLEGEPSLAELSFAWKRVIVIDDPALAPLDIESFGIAATDPAYGEIEALLVEMRYLMNASGSTSEKDQIQTAYRTLIAMVAAEAKSRAAAALESRLDGLALLSATSTSSWYAARTGAAEPAGSVRETLEADLREASRVCLAERARLEAAALAIASGTAHGHDTSEAATQLALWWSGDDQHAAAARESLLELSAFIHTHVEDDDAAFNEGVESLAANDPVIAAFARGRGSFVAGGFDAASLFLPGEAAALDRARGRIVAFDRYGPASVAVEDERRLAAVSVLSSMLAGIGVEIDGSGNLPDPRLIMDALLVDADQMAGLVTGLVEAVNQAASIAPSWMASEFRSWREAMLGYAAARGLEAGCPSPGASAGTAATLSEASVDATTLGHLIEGLAGDGPDALESLCRATADLSWSIRESELLETEAARRIAPSLDAGFSAHGEQPDWTAIEAALRSDADDRYGFASERIRSLSVSTALEALRIADAEAYQRDPATLDGTVLEARLAALWSRLDVEGTMAMASGAFNATARTAYAMRSLVFDPLEATEGGATRDELVALGIDGPEGEPSWLTDFYASEGQDAGAAMETLLAIAAGPDTEPWNSVDARARVEAAASATLAGLSAFRDHLRDGMGAGSVVVERLLAVTIAVSSPGSGYLDWVLGSLGLAATDGVAAFIADTVVDPVAEAFLGLGPDPLAGSAAAHYLTALALSGDTGAFLAHSGRAGPAAAARGTAILDLRSAADRYAGDYSGDVLSWAARQRPSDPGDAVALARFLESGSIVDPLVDQSLAVSGRADPFERWLLGTVSDRLESVMSGAIKTAAPLTFQIAFEQASAAAAAATSTGEKHWRTCLAAPSTAAALASASGTALPLPGLAGDPEGPLGAAPRAAADWTEGYLADAYEEAARRTEALSAAFSSWSTMVEQRAGTTGPSDDQESPGNPASAFSDFAVRAQAYLDAPETSFDETDVIRSPSYLAGELQTAYGEYATLAYRRDDSRKALARLGKAYSIASDQGAVTARLAALQLEQSAARSAHDQAMTEYCAASMEFESAGGRYEAAYSDTKARYAEQEQARADYEKEDAIRRWASTAYLSAAEEDDPGAVASSYRSPATELAYAETSLARAAAALSALESLYDDTAAARPYTDPEYAAACAVYRENYRRMMLCSEANEALSGALKAEYGINDDAYEAYRACLFGGQDASHPTVAVPLGIYSSYAAPASAGVAGWTDFLTLRPDGTVGLAHGPDFRLQAVDAAAATRLDAYFSQADIPSGSDDTRGSTAYERDVRAWFGRIAATMNSPERFAVWAMARDHLVAGIIQANPEFSALSAGIAHATNLYSTVGQTHLNGSSIASQLDAFSAGPLAEARRNSWNSLGDQERADLEFFVIMSLTGGAGNTRAAFESATSLKEYEYVSGIVQARIDSSISAAQAFGTLGTAFAAFGMLLSWTPVGPIYLGLAAVQFGLGMIATGDAHTWMALKSSSIDPGLGTARATLGSGSSVLAAQASAIQISCAAYHASCVRIGTIKGIATEGIDALADFRSSLQATGGMSGAEVDSLVALYDEYARTTGAAYSSAADAVAAVSVWTAAARDVARAEVERIFIVDEKTRIADQSVYQAVYDRYLAGAATDGELAASVRAAYGSGAASLKAHLAELAGISVEAALGKDGDTSTREFAEAARSYASLVARASEARYSAELSAREAEWDVLRRDLSDKAGAWRQAAGLILARGRSDFDAGSDMVRARARAWNDRFTDEYGSRTAAWNFAYAGLAQDRLDWVSRATEAAANASTEALLALVGADADAAARRLDSFTVSRMDIDDGAASYYEEAMARAGIAALSSAMEAQASSVATISGEARRGVSGAGCWDSARIRVAAVDFAEKSRERISGVQARVVAARARQAAELAVSGLGESVRRADDDFGNSMRATFVDGGLWKRQGGNYVKDIVVHSTVAAPYITECASVEAYRSYAMNPWRLGTDLSDGTLAALDHDAVQVLIAAAQQEVARKSEEVFGTPEENGDAASKARTRTVDVFRSERAVTGSRVLSWTDRDGELHTRTVDVYETRDVLDHTETQAEGAGEFGRHLGYAPVVKLCPNPDDGQEAMFQAAGSGELGRLMASYFYWSLKEGKGWSEASKPAYEKDLWDDRGQWMQAPTIRGVADIGMTVVAGALTGGAGAVAMNLVDDALFGMMDVSGGYAGWEEAALAFGKKTASSAVSFAGGQVFGGALSGLGSAGSAGRIIGTTARTGMRGVAGSVASSAIGAVGLRYDDGGNAVGLSFSDELFSEGVFGETAVASYLGAMAGSAFGASVNQGGNFSGRLWSGFTGLGTMASTEGATYAAHLGYSAARGNSGKGMLADAWNNHGGITFSAVNLGSVMEAAGFLKGIAGNGYDAGERAAESTFARAFSGAGLSLTLGAGGISGSLGGGGYDLVDMGMRIGKGLVLHDKLDEFSASRGSSFRESLETAYGYGDAAAEETIWRLALGKDTLVLDDGTGKAETTIDSSGNRILRLMASGGGTEAMLDLAITLQHEAWRDGLDGGGAGQRRETFDAASAHTRMALGLGRSGEYGASMVSLASGNINFSEDIAHYLDGSFASYAGSSYDASGDYWKLTKEGRLVNDGRARLLAEVVNDDGSTGWQLVEGSDEELSTSAALVHYLGADRSMEIFAGSLADVSRFDDQTLHDVLNLDDVDIKAIRNNSGEAARVLGSASEEQRQRLLGEALMKDAGITWSGSAAAWSGEGSGIMLSRNAIQGNAAIRSIGDGYERFSITSEIERREGAYDVWRDGVKGDVGEGNSRISFTKWSIDSGEQLATIVAGGAWNTVDNSHGQLDAAGHPIGADQPYRFAFGPLVQGNTIAAGPLNMRWAQARKADWGDVMILSDTADIAGERIAADGRRIGHPYEDRWLMHITQFGSSDGCFVYRRGTDSTDQFVTLMRSLSTWGLYQGYSISGALTDANEFAYKPGFKTGSW